MPNPIIVKPSRLKIGDTIGIVAPSWSFDADNFIKGVKKLRYLGFKVKYNRSIFSKYWSMAGYDKERAAQINQMFYDKDVKAIFCAKAGYGSARTLPFLNAAIIRRNPKIFVGYSDLTMLLLYLFKTANMVVFHGPVVSDEIYEGMSPITLDYLLGAIAQPYPLGNIRHPDARLLRSGKAGGILVGGNMSLVINAIGTPYDIDTDNKILFLEDIGEDLEVIDSYLMHLKLAGKLNKVKGIIFGMMFDCIDYSGKKFTLRNVVDDILSDLKIPMIYNFRSGHARRGDINVTLPFGVYVKLDADKKTLTVCESGVSL
ncbi:MAG: LD-carboxypeptidase [Candidatus Omnitrophota bacterium]